MRSSSKKLEAEDLGENGDPLDNAVAEADPPTPTQPAHKGPVQVGRSLEITTTPDVCMDQLVDKLRLLDYERDFCRRKKPYRKPLTRTYFAVPLPNNNHSEQFFYFSSLVAWLLQQAGTDFPTPKEFADPIETCQNIFSALKKLGFALPTCHPTKLTSNGASGKEVVGILDGLVDYVLEKRGFSLKRPVYQPDNYPEEADVDDENEAAAGALGMPTDVDDEVGDQRPEEEEEEEEAYMDGLRPPEKATTGSAEETAEKQILVSKVDPTAWKLELERVGPRLRITLTSDARDWRSHLEQAHQHQTDILTAWPESKTHLDRLGQDLNGSLDKLVTREKVLNEQFDLLLQQYRARRVQLMDLQESYNKRTENISERNNELHRIQEQLEEVKRIMDERNNNISDSSPVVRIKTAIKKLTEELREMEVKIGVVSHTLLSLSLKDKHRMNTVVESDDEYD